MPDGTNLWTPTNAEIYDGIPDTQLVSGVRLKMPKAYRGLWKPARNKAFYGGRGAARSWSISQTLIALALNKPLRIGCFREYQSSIADSVHQVLQDMMKRMGVSHRFYVTRTALLSDVGASFIFKGLHHNYQEIKSIEGLDIAWVEEAQNVSHGSLEILRPTVRKDAPFGPFGKGSELWFSFNTGEEDDPIYNEMVTRNPPDSIVKLVTYKDNPYFPAVLERERQYMLEIDPEAHEHIWEGTPRKLSDAVIFKKRVIIHNFDTPPGTRFFHGADWGFSSDPTCLVRCWIDEDKQELFIDREAYAHGCELEEIPALFDKIETARKWPIKGDSSRPETISYVRRKGFNIEGAEKWNGSVEDGIAHILGFRKIHIHERNCPHAAEESKLYRYKVDKKTEEILPIVVDAHNHIWDSVRYSLDKYIKKRGGLGVWSKL